MVYPSLKTMKRVKSVDYRKIKFLDKNKIFLNLEAANSVLK